MKKLTVGVGLALVAAVTLTTACGKKSSSKDKATPLVVNPPDPPAPTAKKADDPSAVSFSGQLALALDGSGLVDSKSFDSYWLTFEKKPETCSMQYDTGADFQFSCLNFANKQFGGFIKVPRCEQPVPIVVSLSGKKSGSLKSGHGKLKMAIKLDAENCVASADVDLAGSDGLGAFAGTESKINDMTGAWSLAFGGNDAPGYSDNIAKGADAVNEAPDQPDECGGAAGLCLADESTDGEPGKPDGVVKYFAHDTSTNKVSIWYSDEEYKQCHDDKGAVTFALDIADTVVPITKAHFASVDAWISLFSTEVAKLATDKFAARLDAEIEAQATASKATDGWLKDVDAAELGRIKTTWKAQAYQDLVREGAWYDSKYYTDGYSFCSGFTKVAAVDVPTDPAPIADVPVAGDPGAPDSPNDVKDPGFYMPLHVKALCAGGADALSEAEVDAIMTSIATGAPKTCLPDVYVGDSFDDKTDNAVLAIQCATADQSCVDKNGTIIAPVQGLEAELDLVPGVDTEDGFATADLSQFDSYDSTTYDEESGKETPCSYSSYRGIGIIFENAEQTKFTGIDSYIYKDSCKSTAVATASQPPMPEDATPTAAGLADDSKDADTYSTDGDAAAKSEDAVISSDEFDAGKDDGDFQYSMTNYYTKVK